MTKTTTLKSFWQTIPTIQFVEIISTLEACKKTGKTSMLIGNTGHCKTHAVDKFCSTNKEYTYRITVNSSYRLNDLIDELAEMIGVKIDVTRYRKSNKRILDAIAAELIKIKKKNGKPIIIIDEGENMEVQMLKMIKGLYDLLKNECAIVLIGTPRLVNRMLNLNDKGGSGRNRNALPELYRRFKAYHKNITPINKERDFKPFFNKYVEDKGLQKLLCQLCENYGELHDYLEPALVEAADKNVPLTEDTFRIMHNLPKYQ